MLNGCHPEATALVQQKLLGAGGASADNHLLVAVLAGAFDGKVDQLGGNAVTLVFRIDSQVLDFNLLRVVNQQGDHAN